MKIKDVMSHYKKRPEKILPLLNRITRTAYIDIPIKYVRAGFHERQTSILDIEKAL
ncbi:MAG: hypothetical protein JW774_12355 [Candidatus Aureabacteria bacterium]|nr:hypothetical protein [Candidatus Auribacterota bacterium]